MRYVAAYCLAAQSGAAPTAKDIEKILGAAGIDCDAEKAKKVVSELTGKNLEEIISKGIGKLGTMPSGGGGTAAGAAAPAASAPAAKAKEEKKEEPEEESDEDMGFGLFD